MNILKLILDNLRQGTASYKLPHKHECTSNRYRGLIHNDPERCVGCSACAYVCPTGAIEVKRAGENYSWSYDPGKCTFCERCIERCRPNTLTMESQLPPLYSHEGELKTVLEMVRKRPVKPATPAVAAATAAASAAAKTVATEAKPAVTAAMLTPSPEPAK